MMGKEKIYLKTCLHILSDAILVMHVTLTKETTYG